MNACPTTPRLTRTFVQYILATPEQVFPLLCPEREKHWLPGWDARVIHSASGVAERGAVFETRHDAGRTLWLVTEYDPPRRIAFARWQPDALVVHIEIDLGRHHNNYTAVCVSYAYTAVDEAGLAALSTAAGEETWLKTMSFWEGSMNAWFEKHALQSAAPH